MSRSTKFIAALALQLAIISVMIMFKSSIVVDGQTIMLRVGPVDPRDPLRGDYMILDYPDIEQVPSSSFAHDKMYNGDTVYVPLRKNGDVMAAGDGITRQLPGPDFPLFIKARIVRGAISNPRALRDPDDAGRRPLSDTITLDYGINEFFIPENTGRDFWRRNANVTVEVSVDEQGNAVLTELFVNGQPWN